MYDIETYITLPDLYDRLRRILVPHARQGSRLHFVIATVLGIGAALLYFVMTADPSPQRDATILIVGVSVFLLWLVVYMIWRMIVYTDEAPKILAIALRHLDGAKLNENDLVLIEKRSAVDGTISPTRTLLPSLLVTFLFVGLTELGITNFYIWLTVLVGAFFVGIGIILDVERANVASTIQHALASYEHYLRSTSPKQAKPNPDEH